jgi:predicted N-acetyltransferase YhbS
VITLGRETADDWWQVEALYDLCFAPGREALSSYRLRDGVDPVADLCLVARDGGGDGHGGGDGDGNGHGDNDDHGNDDGHGILAAAIRYWPVRVGAAPALLLGPIAVHPTRQGEGLGASLIADSLARAAGHWDRVLLVGDAPYYGRFGFEKLDRVQMPPPTNPDRVLGLALTPGAWDGVAGKVAPLRAARSGDRA